ncbi:uncharacterized protein LTR77_008859 [Saxophila tyrrhenica]|uniref:Uncharacterized protein n=1 Tax=Saxophila tyrrhenica TaxID=1690608 RepID=A0AAV9P0G4_9PEZI|nr:hypothetical protein LTR77_008859 [Saxophila tyrrhenica]
MSLLTPGRILITLANLSYSVGAFLADWSETHVLNPRWPPHARFHNGQTMSLGVCLAASSIWFMIRPGLTSNSSGKGATVAEAKRGVFDAALVGSFYCTAGMCAILYPGTDWTDPEFGVGGEQKLLFPGIVAAMWVGYALEMWRLGDGKGKGA